MPRSRARPKRITCLNHLKQARLADGSVQQNSSTGLQGFLQMVPQTNRLAIP